MICGQCGAENANPGSGLCPQCEQQSAQKINGLLYLPALGLITSALYGVLNLFYISRLVLDHLHQTGHVTAYALFLVIGLLVDVAMTLYACNCFFRRLRRTRKVMVAYYLVEAAYAFYVVAVPIWLYNAHPNGTELRIAGSALCGLVIWVPYFLRSKRVLVVFSR